MKSLLLIALLSAVALPAAEQTLWYRQPATDFESALPVGNGRLGAMVFGGIQRERIQINEETIWSGAPKPKRASSLEPELMRRKRALLFAGKHAEADALKIDDLRKEGLRETFTEIPGTASGRHAYQPLGELFLHFIPDEAVESGYRRELNLDTGIASVSWEAGGARFRREIFSSYPDQVLVVRLECDRPGRLTFTATMTRPVDVKDHVDRYAVESEFTAMREMAPPPPAIMTGTGPGSAVFRGQASDDGAKFEARFRVVHEGGAVEPHPRGFAVKAANAVTILITAGTDFRGASPEKLALERMERAARKDFALLRRDHVADHQRLFRRVELDLGHTANSDLPLDKRLLALQWDVHDPRTPIVERDPGLFALHFQFARYLMIASSRPGTLPPALQGLWNDSLLPPWFGQHTSDINVQMNYWPVEVANLAECHLPLLDLIESFVPAGRMAARLGYGAGGLVINGMTNYGPKNSYTDWADFSGWIAQDFWEHYAFSGDLEYLRKRAYPFLKEVAQFYLDTLAEHPASGKLVTLPAYSPENTYRRSDGKQGHLGVGVTMSMGIARDVFANFLDSARALDADAPMRARVQAALARMEPYRIGRHGQLQEWLEDWEEVDPGHRHLSHLLPLHPGRSIAMRGDPRLAEAARKGVLRRIEHGSGWTGWSRAWLINLAARILDGQLAREQYIALLRRATHNNLFDSHPRRAGNTRVFQIEGNFGAAAGLAEMLVQSHDGEIHLLPALPKEWHTGSFRGLRARGGFEVDASWKGGKLQSATIRSARGGTAHLRYAGRTRSIDVKPGAAEKW